MRHISKEYVIWLADFAESSNIYRSPPVCQTFAGLWVTRRQISRRPDLPETLKSDPDIGARSNPSHGYGTWLDMNGDTRDKREDVAARKQSQGSEPVSSHPGSMPFLIILFLEYVTLKRRYPQREARGHLNGKGNC